MQQTRPTFRTRARGFSLTEMLVVISVIVLLIAIIFPLLSGLQTGSRIEAGLNTIGMSVDVARQWVKPSAWTEDTSDDVDGERYNGVAALICPTREVRIVTNFRKAKDSSGNFLEEYSPEANGYWDRRGIDYVTIPYGVGVVGVLRTSGGARFIAPPFAVSFNEFGHLDYGNGDGLIFYDADGDGTYDTNSKRPSSYDPEAWDADSSNALQDFDTTLRYALPFEAIECVPGVVIFDLESFTKAGFSFDGGDVTVSGDAGEWLKENGQTIFFSPHTGSPLRDEQ